VNTDFLCKCGHRNKIHITTEEAIKERYFGRICVEYRDAICVKDVWYHNKEAICSCYNFIPDNLNTLEQLSESHT